MTEEVFRAALNVEPLSSIRGVMSFGTGEPTVHTKFWDFLNLALTDGRWKIRVVTNGKRTDWALKVAELGKEGKIQAHLSLDQWHDPIKQEVIEAFKRDPSNTRDRRSYRFCEEKDLKNLGSCDFGTDKRPMCRCPVPKITVDGSIYNCGCETAVKLGHVLSGWDKTLLQDRSKLGCARYLPGSDKGENARVFFSRMGKLIREGTDR